MTDSKRDWKLFQKKLAQWQESYMEKLEKEYVVYLNSDKPAFEKFWELEKRIQQDKKKPGVRMQIEKADVEWDIARLIMDGVITLDDVNDFTDDTKETVKKILDSYANKNRSII